MSKKKKFPGKKTKLAEHALTQVLEQEKSEAPSFPESPPSSLTLAQAVQALRNDQLHLDLPVLEGRPIPSQDQLETANAYLLLIQELEGMRDLLRPPNIPTRPRAGGEKSGTLPNSEIISYSLKVIGHTLKEIKSMLGS